jgi:hypothetical protein
MWWESSHSPAPKTPWGFGCDALLRFLTAEIKFSLFTSYWLLSINLDSLGPAHRFDGGSGVEGKRPRPAAPARNTASSLPSVQVGTQGAVKVKRILERNGLHHPSPPTFNIDMVNGGSVGTRVRAFWHDWFRFFL